MQFRVQLTNVKHLLYSAISRGRRNKISHFILATSQHHTKPAVNNITITQAIINNVSKKVKVKCILVQALRLCTGCTAQRRSRGIALLFLDHGTKRV